MERLIFLSLELDYEIGFHKLIKIDLKLVSKQGKPKLFKGKINVNKVWFNNGLTRKLNQEIANPTINLI